MGDWRDAFRSAADPRSLQHPHARAGGVGPAAPRLTQVAWMGPGVPHPGAPGGGLFDWISLPEIDIDDRACAVFEAVGIAQEHALAAVKEETGEQLDGILDGLLQGLLFCMAVVAATTAIGGLAGAAIGALAGGVGAAPGAVAGAGFGLDVGLALLDILGLTFLVASIGSSLVESSQLSVAAIKEAWAAVDEPRSRSFHVDHAGRTLARAFGVLMRGVLEGIVAFLLAKGTGAAASRVPELVSKLKNSRLGAGFATWIEGRWQALLRNDRLRAKPQSTTGEPGGGTSGGAAPPAPSAPRPKPPVEAPSAAPKPASRPAEKPPPSEQKPQKPPPKNQPLPKGAKNPNAKAKGTPEPVDPRAKAVKQRDIERQNDSADALAREGYDIEHNQDLKPNGKQPDYKIDGEYVDHLNPRTNNVEQARTAIARKVPDQAERVVVRLDDSNLSPKDVQGVLERKPVEGLKEVIFIKDGNVTSYVP